ncbi:MAG: hypothetical protein KatS3mg104_0129 [Phycisphaerae bacterium]|nr:MAG: hypothetical protein KatS3mg104_0129 [Phycisphaerae bacterium]
MINVPDGGIQHQFDGYTLLALGWGGLGLVLRLIVLWSSLGTNDTYYWYEFGLLVDRVGLIRAYDLHPSLNHPFLPTLWASVCYSLSQWIFLGLLSGCVCQPSRGTFCQVFCFGEFTRTGVKLRTGVGPGGLGR